MAFIGQFDLCLSMNLHVKYGAAKMLDSPELKLAIEKVVKAAKKNNKILGTFLFGNEKLEHFHK